MKNSTIGIGEALPEPLPKQWPAYVKAWAVAIVLLLATANSYAQPDAVDNCSGLASAEYATVGSTCINFNYYLTDFTNDGPAPCSGSPTMDGWYKINSGSNTSIAIVASALVPHDVGLAAYTGSCGSLTQVACTVPNITFASLLFAATTNTDYFIRVMRTSGTGNTIGSICILGFDCASSLPHAEGLNSATPPCWFRQQVTRVSGSAPSLTYVTTSTSPNGFSATEGSGFFQFNSHQVQSGTQIRLCRAAIDASTATGVDVKFDWLKNTDAPSNPDNVQVQYSLDGVSWINAGATISRVGTNGWSAQKVSIPDAVGQSRVYIGLLFTGRFSGYRCHIDNIRIEDPAGCSAPTSLGVTNIAATGATASWAAASGSPAGYNWEVRSSGLGGSGSTGLVASGSTASDTRQAIISGLLPNSSYQLYVRSSCGTDNNSTWAASNSFSTLIFCNPPTGLTIADISSSGGLTSWAAPATSTPAGYNWEIRSTGQGGSGSTGLIASGSTMADTREAHFSGLVENTSYNLYVRSTCGADGTGSWAGPASFTSSCSIRSVPWAENFDGLSVGTNGSTIFPACWKNGAGNWATYQSPPLNANVSAPRSGSNVLANVFDNSDDEDIWTPGFELTAGIPYTFAFWYRDRDGSSYNWDGSVMVNNSQSLTGASMVGEKFLTATTRVFGSYTQVTKHFTPATSGIYYFAVVLKDLDIFGTGGLTFDDFSLARGSSCLQPDLTTPSNITAISSQLNWGVPTANSAGYEWEVRSANNPGSGTTGLGASGSSAMGSTNSNAAGLSPNQTYGIYARSNCTTHGYSVWSGPIRLNTPDVLAVGTIITFSSMDGSSISGTALIGSTNNTIMAVRIPVTGSDINNSLTLTGIVFHSKNTDDYNDVQVGTAKLWTGTSAGPTTQVAAVSLVDGKASFSGLSINLPVGNNHLWLTYDVAPEAGDGNKLAAEVKAGDITIVSTGGANTGGTQPATNLEHLYHRIIKTRAYCAIAMNPGGFGAISRVQITTPAPVATIINHSSEEPGTLAWGFEDFYNIAGYVTQGSTYNFRADLDYNGSGYSFSVWADLNLDGDFGDTGEKLYQAAVSGSSRSGSFTIPATATPGKTTIRFIFSDLSQRPNATACGTFGWGQVEDYQLIITEPICQTPLAQPTALILTPSGSQVAGSFTPSASADGYLVVRTETAAAPQSPVNTLSYFPGTEKLGGFIEYAGSGTSFLSAQGLVLNTSYWYWVFAFNNSDCSEGPVYLTTSPLMAQTTTQSSCSGNTLAYDTDELDGFVFTGSNAQELLIPNTCRSLARITPCSGLVGENSLWAKVWIDKNVNYYNEKAYVPRRYEFTPAIEPEDCTATLTLYYSQNDFDRYNQEAGNELFVRLPTGPDDSYGKANLRVYQFHGPSGEATGLPESYPYYSTTTTINPMDNQIVWNTDQQRWEVTITITGFSTFIVGSSGLDLLPVKFISFTGSKAGNNALLQWQTAAEENLNYFLVENSVDGLHFTTIGQVQAKGTANNTYQQTTPLKNGASYYRIKAVDKDGSFTYTQVIRLHVGIFTKHRLYPMPAKDYVLLAASDAGLLGSTARLTTMQGKTIRSIVVSQLPLRIETGALPAGLYLLKLSDNTVLKLLKQ